MANDDFERQARNTTSSLEDMESKYNQAIERAVMMEEEIKQGEQEREKMRIDTQRLREELSDLKIEAELLQDKVKKSEARHLSTISTDISVPESPMFDRNVGTTSPQSTASSPLVTTPPDTKSMSTADTLSEVHDPPSPPMSDSSAPLPRKADAASRRVPATKGEPRKSRLPSADTTPKPRGFKPPTTNPRLASGRPSTGNPPLRTPANRSTQVRSQNRIPGSNSLTHIRTLTAQMQRLEARVHSARSKLPAPTTTPPRFSPRSSVNGSNIPSTITVRSRKRTSASSSAPGEEQTPTHHNGSARSHVPRLSESRVSRLSYGPIPNRGPESDFSRPSSRTSMSSRPSSRTDMAPPRPISRTSVSGARTPLGRPRSSLGGSLHGHSASISRMDEEDEPEGEFRTPSRRGMYSKFEPGRSTSGIPAAGSGIPVPGSRRQSGAGRRASKDGGGHIGGRPSISQGQKLEDLGETY